MKKIRLLILAVLLMIGTAGCTEEKKDGTGYQVYVTNDEATKLLTEAYSTKSTETEAVLGELLERFAAPSVAGEHYSILPDGVEIEDFSLADEQLTVTFNETYLRVNAEREILLRAGLVLTAVQVKGVRTVVFHVGEDVLRDSAGEPIGAMTGSLFLKNPVGINSYQYASLSLYFSNKSGNKIVRELRNVHYSSNTTLERVVLEQLMKGPMNGQLLSVLPDNIKILGITTDKDLCTVNLSKEFLSVRDEDQLMPEVTIYSIVNSLCDMLNVERVQFQVEGQSNVLYKKTLSLNGPFHRNSDIIETAESTEAEQESSKGLKPSIGL